MVRALLAGTKTQTRRVVKPQPKGTSDPEEDRIYLWPESPSGWQMSHIDGAGVYSHQVVTCKQGMPGDRLWVKETWKAWERESDGLDHILYRADDAKVVIPNSIECADQIVGKFDCWHPSIFMRRWMSRITLEITGIRVERLQDISDADAQAEGFPYHPMQLEGAKRRWYRELWESINGPGSWDVNPWVWVIGLRNWR